MKKPEKILVIRNDKLGDFMLAWPAFSLLKNQFPETEITALVPEYTAPMAEQCQWIDKVLIDNRRASSLTDILALTKNIKNNNYDLSISLFSETRTSLALFLARVAVRVGPATKIAQVFLNKTLRQKRSQSTKPEYEYNIDLIKFYIKYTGDTPADIKRPPFLHFDETEIQTIKNMLVNEHALDNRQTLFFIHPGTGGSAINLSLEQYAQLAHIIAKQNEVYFVVTAGPGELEIAQKLSKLLTDVKHHIHYSTGSIIEFSKFLNISDVFISGSTGPLHIAAALNVRTVAFYPAKRSATSLRWKTINDEDKQLAFTLNYHTNNGKLLDMKNIGKEIICNLLNVA